MRRIAVLTSGGDAPGMNAAIRAVVRCGIAQGMEVYGVERGYEGLIKGLINKMDSRSVSDTIHRGGTILKTARCPEFNTKEGREKAYEVLRAYNIEGLIVIGGDGSFRGIKDLHDDFGFPCVGIPGTIDNDLAYTDYTLGFDTAVNTVLNAINNIRDTMTSHDRACIIEVMGRHCGDIALYSGIAGGAEAMLVPEIPFDLDALCNNMKKNIIKGKVSDIIILAEGVCSAAELKCKIEDKVPVSIRTVKLGYIQRGGTPTMADRLLAARCGYRAVELIKNGNLGARVVGIRENKIIDMDITEALNMPRIFDKDLYKIATLLAQ
ncbi:MAG: 6-phosphofructokinase [Clostridiales bacterium]|jgi:6-phosphofructokinase 1|nr:6-phosphofructokinase [Clostridiales bacterium]HOK81191.1 6-phosphofructokinase [Clostridia bacterium]HOL60310.1 6-phosphofructokinase [Clostridia bacterium]HPO53067.1 6-phosphofructokinase [Clostridia bacterium]